MRVVAPGGVHAGRVLVSGVGVGYWGTAEWRLSVQAARARYHRDCAEEAEMAARRMRWLADEYEDSTVAIAFEQTMPDVLEELYTQ